jgi:uncharacterized tellurite resistance protein B-like protein
MAILERVREFLGREGPLARDRSGDYADMNLWVETVVLLLEVAYGDTQYADRERRVIRRSVAREFGILQKDARALMESAERARPEQGDLSGIARRIRDQYDEKQRQRIVALLWKVVEADGVVEDFEEAFASHVARLVELTPEQNRQARSMVARGEV